MRSVYKLSIILLLRINSIVFFSSVARFLQMQDVADQLDELSEPLFVY